MENCCNLYFLSAVSCQLAECLSEQELTILASDLMVVSDMLANLLERKAICTLEEKEIS